MDIDSFLLNAHAFEGILIEKYQTKLPLFFLLDGNALEFKIVNGKRRVIRFFGPNQFIFRLNSAHEIEILNRSGIITLPYGKVIKLFRKHPEIVEIHRKVKRDYLRKKELFETERRKKNTIERYFDLMERQPWVFRIAEPADIASYLNISLTQYERMTEVN
ncbi:hypothetical protein [Pedobacter sp. GR22-6]|uniref:hypothetical protein n=1 Tax=Pedobacter sp. GR22-6 TaxID=3127957 RepID=UPI00307FC010